MGLLKLFEPRDLSPKAKQSPYEHDDLVSQFQRTRLNSTPTKPPVAQKTYYYNVDEARHGAYRASPPARATPSPQPKRFLETPPRPVYSARPASDPTMHSSSHDTSPISPRGRPAMHETASGQSTPVKANQCHGTTATGKRCTRVVPLTASTPRSRTQSSPTKLTSPLPRASPQHGPPLTENALVQLDRMLSRRGKGAKEKKRAPVHDGSSTSGSEQDEVALEMPRFCHQHSKQAMEEPGSFAGPKGIYVIYDEWIPADLPQETRLQLRHEMTKPVSAHEKPGYIYALEMAPASPQQFQRKTLLKVGRSVRPVARHNQWKRQCPSRIPLVRDFFPLHPSHPLLHRPNSPYSIPTHHQPPREAYEGSRLRGAFLVKEHGCPFHHRLERLILIECAGRAAMDSAGYERKACVDCGKTHIELFEVNAGAYEAWVCDTILRWIMFCEKVLAA